MTAQRVIQRPIFCLRLFSCEKGDVDIMARLFVEREKLEGVLVAGYEFNIPGSCELGIYVIVFF